MDVTELVVATGFAVTPTSLEEPTWHLDARISYSRVVKGEEMRWSVGRLGPGRMVRACGEARGAGGEREMSMAAQQLRRAATFTRATHSHTTSRLTLATSTTVARSSAILHHVAPFSCRSRTERGV